MEKKPHVVSEEFDLKKDQMDRNIGSSPMTLEDRMNHRKRMTTPTKIFPVTNNKEVEKTEVKSFEKQIQVSDSLGDLTLAQKSKFNSENKPSNCSQILGLSSSIPTHTVIPMNSSIFIRSESTLRYWNNFYPIALRIFLILVCLITIDYFTNERERLTVNPDGTISIYKYRSFLLNYL